MKSYLIKGDCLKRMQNLPDKSIDMILCDLPYGMTRNKWDSVIPLEDLWRQYSRIAKDRCAIVLTASQPFTSVLVSSQVELFNVEWVWIKNRGGNFMNCKIQPIKEHESVLVFCKGKPVYNPIMQERAAGSSSLIGKVPGHGKISENYNKRHHVSRVLPKLRYPSSWQKFNTQTKPDHPTQKPVLLMEYFIKTYTNEGMIVLDNCMGSGTTGVACRNLNRHFIGIEKDDKYFDICMKRIEGAKKKSSINVGKWLESRA